MTGALGIGVIGVGGMGARHVENIARYVGSARVAAVMDTSDSRRTTMAGVYDATAYEDPQDLIAADDVDAVIIASPDATHAELTLACVAHHKPVLCEKPLATSLDAAAAVVEADATRHLVQVGFMRHYDPQHVAVKETIDRGAIGTPLYFRGWHRNPRSAWKPSTRDVLISSAIHDLYSARWLLNSEISEISAQGMPINLDRSRELELQVITMRMASGALGVIEVNADSAYGYEVGVEVVGSEGTVSIAPHHTPPVRGGRGITQRVESDWLERFSEAYIREAREWVEGVVTGRHSGPTAWDGYATLAAAEAGVVALQQGAQAVQLGTRTG